MYDASVGRESMEPSHGMQCHAVPCHAVIALSLAAAVLCPVLCCTVLCIARCRAAPCPATLQAALCPLSCSAPCCAPHCAVLHSVLCTPARPQSPPAAPVPPPSRPPAQCSPASHPCIGGGRHLSVRGEGGQVGGQRAPFWDTWLGQETQGGSTAFVRVTHANEPPTPVWTRHRIAQFLGYASHANIGTRQVCSSSYASIKRSSLQKN